MLLLFFKLNFLICLLVESKEDSEDNDLGVILADSMKLDTNLDATDDEEYEDLRAEFLAYRTALASLTSGDGLSVRRSMLSTPCWQLSGICINYKLCAGFSYLTQVPGCKDKLKVCCFVWDRYKVRDMRDYDIRNVAMPWNLQREFGGKGIIDKTTKRRGRRNRTRTTRGSRALALVVRSK